MKYYYLHALNCMTSEEISRLRGFVWMVGGNYWFVGDFMIIKVPTLVEYLPTSPDYYYEITTKDFMIDLLREGYVYG